MFEKRYFSSARFYFLVSEFTILARELTYPCSEDYNFPLASFQILSQCVFTLSLTNKPRGQIKCKAWSKKSVIAWGNWQKMLRESQQLVNHPYTNPASTPGNFPVGHLPIYQPCQTEISAIGRESPLSFSWIDRILFKYSVCYSSCCFVFIFRFWVKTITYVSLVVDKRLVGPFKKVFHS